MTEEYVKEIAEKIPEDAKEVKIKWTGVYSDGVNNWFNVAVDARMKYKRNFVNIISFSLSCSKTADHHIIDMIADKLCEKGFKVTDTIHTCGLHIIYLKR